MTDQNLSDAQPEELAIVHEARATLYRSLFELLRKPPRAETIAAAAATLEGQVAGHRSAHELAAALRAADLTAAQADYGRLFAPPQPIVAMRCKRPNCGVRDSAFNAADTLPGGERVSELHVLSVLADRTAQAYCAGKVLEAVAFTDAQAKLLSFHAGACLADMAQELAAGSSALYAQVGRTLGFLIEQDLKLLGRS